MRTILAILMLLTLMGCTVTSIDPRVEPMAVRVSQRFQANDIALMKLIEEVNALKAEKPATAAKEKSEKH
jgi:hypothetical protein